MIVRKARVKLVGLVISDTPDQYTNQKGQIIRSQMLSVVDQEQNGARLKQSCDYVLSDEEKENWAGKLQDKKIEIGITEISIFGGRPRLRGKINLVDGKPLTK